MIMTGNPYDGDDHLPAGICSIIHCYDVLILAAWCIRTQAGAAGGSWEAYAQQTATGIANA